MITVNLSKWGILRVLLRSTIMTMLALLIMDDIWRHLRRVTRVDLAVGEIELAEVKVEMAKAGSRVCCLNKNLQAKAGVRGGTTMVPPRFSF